MQCQSLLRVTRSAHIGEIRRCFSCSSPARLQLAYDVWEPPESSKALENSGPILFIHGLFGSKKNNRTMSKILAKSLSRPVYALDLRNHGDSPHAQRHDYIAMAEDVEEFMTKHDMTKPTLIGHSMGAKVAMTVALRKPSSVGNLISVDNAPVDAALKSDFGKYVRGMKDIEEAKVHRQSEADEILKQYEESLPIRQFLLANLVRATQERGSPLSFRIPIKTLGAALDNMADFPMKDPDEVQYNGPTLFIRGTKSHYVADEMLPVIGRFFPRFELFDIESGHWVISENPMAFKDAVINFLSDKS